MGVSRKSYRMSTINRFEPIPARADGREVEHNAVGFEAADSRALADEWNVLRDLRRYLKYARF